MTTIITMTHHRNLLNPLVAKAANPPAGKAANPPMGRQNPAKDRALCTAMILMLAAAAARNRPRVPLASRPRVLPVNLLKDHLASPPKDPPDRAGLVLHTTDMGMDTITNLLGIFELLSIEAFVGFKSIAQYL